jgi:hypothetical protein
MWSWGLLKGITAHHPTSESQYQYPTGFQSCSSLVLLLPRTVDADLCSSLSVAQHVCITMQLCVLLPLFSLYSSRFLLLPRLSWSPPCAFSPPGRLSNLSLAPASGAYLELPRP